MREPGRCRPDPSPASGGDVELLGARDQQLDERRRRPERVGDDRPISERQRRLELAVDFDDKDRLNEGLMRIERGETGERDGVVRERVADRDRRPERRWAVRLLAGSHA
jgi:hypothetical protein